MKKYTLAVIAIVASASIVQAGIWDSLKQSAKDRYGRVKNKVDELGAADALQYGIEKYSGKLQGGAQALTQGIDSVNQLAASIGKSAGQLLATYGYTVEQFKALPAATQQALIQNIQQAKAARIAQ